MATKSPNQKNSTKSCCFRMLSRGSKGADALGTWHFSILLLHPLRRCVLLSSFVGLRRWCPHRWSAAPESISQASDGLKPRHFRAGAMSTVRYQKRQKVSRLEPSALLRANHSEIKCLLEKLFAFTNSLYLHTAICVKVKIKRISNQVSFGLDLN